jgi:carbonic anhydrase/acetyltransferase-like protein (isoleucine patch superfamily)
MLRPKRPTVPGKPHPNGGGFVADSAKVGATAYVSPDAQVLGNSVVTGNSRIEDFAVVDNAKIADNAIISGYAIVTENSTVAENAKVRDCAAVAQSTTIRGNARILEHASISTSKTCAGHVTVKGIAHVYGGNQSGTAMIDGFYAKGNETMKGKWFTWSWGQGKNPGEVDEDFRGLYADYDFETEHPWMVQDAFGATWGYLVNSPQFKLCPDKAITKSTLLKPEAVLASLDRQQHGENNYAELLTGFLRPAQTGEYTFWISADDEGELWFGEAGSGQAGKKICGNPFYAGFRDYGRFPSQKSAALLLEKDKSYPLRVVHANTHMGGSLSVSWAKRGSDKPEPIPGECLSITADGSRRGVLQRVWGGVAHVADLVRRPDYPDGTVRESSKVLVFNGKNQFVELPKDVADLRQCAYTVDFKWSGGAGDQRIFEFANAQGEFLCLCPSLKGKLTFAIRQGGKVEWVSAPGVPPDVWTRVQIVLEGSRATLSVNGNDATTAVVSTPEGCACHRGQPWREMRLRR